MPTSKIRIKVQATPEQHARWSAAAKEDGISLSAWLASLADDQNLTGRVEPEAVPEPAVEPVAQPEAAPVVEVSRPPAALRVPVRTAVKEPASSPVDEHPWAVAKGCTAYAPRGTRCRICGQIHA